MRVGDMSRHVLYVMFTQDLDSKEFSSALGDMPPIYLYIVGGMVGCLARLGCLGLVYSQL